MDAIIKALVQGLRDIQITRYAHISSSTIIVFDHLLTLDEEINLIWSSSWTLGKILFLLNRYYSLSAVVFLFAHNHRCFVSSSQTLSQPIRTTLIPHFSPQLRFIQWQGWTGLVGCMLAEAILQMRIYALYSLNKRILALMLSLFLAAMTSAGWILWSELSIMKNTAVSLPTGGKFCVPSGMSSHFYAFWIPLLAYECVLCALATFKGFQTFRTSGSLFQTGRQLVGMLVRDSLLYFLVICATYLTCLLIWILAPPSFLEVPIGFSIAMSCVLANRVVLNVRKISQGVEPSRFGSSKPVRISAYDTSFCSPGTLTVIEMEQLRNMRAQRPYSEIDEPYEYNSGSVNVPFVVL